MTSFEKFLMVAAIAVLIGLMVRTFSPRKKTGKRGWSGELLSKPLDAPENRREEAMGFMTELILAEGPPQDPKFLRMMGFEEVFMEFRRHFQYGVLKVHMERFFLTCPAQERFLDSLRDPDEYPMPTLLNTNPEDFGVDFSKTSEHKVLPIRPRRKIETPNPEAVDASLADETVDLVQPDAVGKDATA